MDFLLQGDTKEVWTQALENELGRLSFGNSKTEGTNTIRLSSKDAIPKTKKVTYANIVCDYTPLKQEKYRVRLTVGGDRLDYPQDASSTDASLLDTKLLLNTVISDSSHC